MNQQNKTQPKGSSAQRADSSISKDTKRDSLNQSSRSSDQDLNRSAQGTRSQVDKSSKAGMTSGKKDSDY